MISSQPKFCAFALLLASVCNIFSIDRSFASDECLSELREIHETEGSIQLPPQEDMCVYLRATFKIDLRYANFFRRCGNGIQGENDAFDYEKRASAVRSLISMNCH